MIGTHIESRPGSWLGIGLALLATAGCLGLGLAPGKPVWLCVAVLPLLIAGALWLGRPRKFVADVSATGLVLSDGGMLEFERIECVLARQISREPFSMLVVCGTWELLIPPNLNVSSRELFEFLLRVAPARPKTPRDPDMAAYYRRQQETFGDRLVWHCSGRRRVGWPREFLRTRWVCTACTLAGIIYMVYGGNTNRSDMLGWGGMLLAFGLIGLLATFAAQRKPAQTVKNSEAASIILCPLGLALVQADIKGELRWDEVRDVRLRDLGSRLTIGQETGQPRIDVQVDGAVIPIFDTYEQPLALIHQRIVALWK